MSVVHERIIVLAATAAMTVSVFAQDWPKLDAFKQPIYDAVWAPQVVAVPFTHAGPESISVDDDGVIMTGGAMMIGGKRMSMSLVSRDCGLNWEKSLYRPNSWRRRNVPGRTTDSM